MVRFLHSLEDREPLWLHQQVKVEWRETECVHVKKRESSQIGLHQVLNFFSAFPPKRALHPYVTAAGSGRVWTSLNSKKSNMKVPSCGTVVVEQNREEGFGVAPHCRSRLGTGSKPCRPPCRGSSLPGPEVARSPALICTYPYTESCRCKGSTDGLIGHLEKGGKEMTA